MNEGASASDSWAEVRDEFRAAVVRVVKREFGLRPSERLLDGVEGRLRIRGWGRVDVLGELIDRLPDALSVAEVCIVLDRFDVALRGHDGSPSIDAADVAPSTDSDPIVGDAPGAPAFPTVDAPGAPSAEVTV